MFRIHERSDNRLTLHRVGQQAFYQDSFAWFLVIPSTWAHLFVLESAFDSAILFFFNLLTSIETSTSTDSQISLFWNLRQFSFGFLYNFFCLPPKRLSLVSKASTGSRSRFSNHQMTGSPIFLSSSSSVKPRVLINSNYAVFISIKITQRFQRVLWVSSRPVRFRCAYGPEETPVFLYKNYGSVLLFWRGPDPFFL